MCRCPVRISRQRKCSQGLQDLRDAHEDLLHARGTPVRSPHQCPCVLEHHDRQLAPHGFALVGPVFPACQGLVLGDVQGHVRLAGKPVAEASFEH